MWQILETSPVGCQSLSVLNVQCTDTRATVIKEVYIKGYLQAWFMYNSMGYLGMRKAEIVTGREGGGGSPYDSTLIVTCV